MIAKPMSHGQEADAGMPKTGKQMSPTVADPTASNVAADQARA